MSFGKTDNPLNENPSEKKSKFTANSKVGFLSSFWDSCFNLDFYTIAKKASWTHIVMRSLLLISIVAFAYTSSAYQRILTKSTEMLKGIPIVEIKDSKATFDKNLSLPYIKRFPPKEVKGVEPFYYILDSGSNLGDLEDTYENYVIFTENELVMSNGSERKATSIKTLEKDTSVKSFFGDPIKFTPDSIAALISSASSLIVFPFFLVLLVLVFPLMNLVIATIATVFEKWPLKFSDILKLSFFAATPASLIQLAFAFLLSNTFGGLGLGMLISFIMHIAYLVTGLRAYKESSSGMAIIS
ncbi:MAG: DUF1189 family protein [Candidatus Melainabacteria bacterium]|jgi:hypothetical protein